MAQDGHIFCREEDIGLRRHKPRHGDIIQLTGRHRAITQRASPPFHFGCGCHFGEPRLQVCILRWMAMISKRKSWISRPATAARAVTSR
jgi:hypothetical protein